MLAILFLFALSISVSPFHFLHLASLLPLQPSSPGDYYSSVESDLKVELTEKLFALDTESNNSPANTEVCPSLCPMNILMSKTYSLCRQFIDLTYEALFTESG